MSTAKTARILSTGSEILQGLYADTNARDLARFLFSRGFEVLGMAGAPDNPSEIHRALENAVRSAHLVVMSGGLGPTEDDVNRDIIAGIYQRELLEDATARQLLEERFARRGVPMPVRNLVQVMLPQGCIPLQNHWGTAPGFILPGVGELATLVALPGPPREWKPMLDAAWSDHLESMFPADHAQALTTLHLANVPESTINERLADLFDGGEAHSLTLLAGTGHIRVRLIGKGRDSVEAGERLAALEAEVLRRLGRGGIYARGGEATTLAEAMIRELAGAGETLATAESCTGGLIAASLTDVPGSSAVFRAGWVTYANEAKSRELGVDSSLIERHGAVSGEVAAAMAQGAVRRAGTTWGVSVTGIAGPDGGTAEKPVGLVWFGLSGPLGTFTLKRHFPGDRGFVRALAALQSLEFLRRMRRGIDPEPLLPPDP